jgi:ribose 5-phosphate isomerase A
MSSDEMKRKAAHAALLHLPETGILGLGTGTTTGWFIEAVGELVRGGRTFSAVPTSNASRALARECGIPLLDDAGPWRIDACFDGADEVSKNLDLIKGGGGAHTREKIVNFASRLNVIIVDESKLVENLGEKRRLPVEVLPFGLHTTLQSLSALGEPKLRTTRDSGSPFLSDSGNYIVDLATGRIGEPGRLDQILRRLPGVVETGLFVARADVVVVAAEDGVRELRRGN